MNRREGRETFEIRDVAPVRDGEGWWLILECGHWYHWTGETEPEVGGHCPCPNCEIMKLATAPAAPDPKTGTHL